MLCTVFKKDTDINVKVFDFHTKTQQQTVVSDKVESPDTDGANTPIFCAASKKHCAEVIVQNANVAAFYTKAHTLSKS